MVVVRCFGGGDPRLADWEHRLGSAGGRLGVFGCLVVEKCESLELLPGTPGTQENTRDCLWGGMRRVRGDWGGVGQGDVVG